LPNSLKRAFTRSFCEFSRIDFIEIKFVSCASFAVLKVNALLKCKKDFSKMQDKEKIDREEGKD